MSTRPQATGTGTVKLEGSDRMIVLFRIAEKQVDRVRVFSEDCELDAGGRPVVWLQNVRPADSVALLETLVVPMPARRDRVTDGAITAIALHGDASADAVTRSARRAPGNRTAVRKKVTFWLGNARGRHGLDTLRRVLRDDPSMEVRKERVFGLSQSREPKRSTAGRESRAPTPSRACGARRCSGWRRRPAQGAPRRSPTRIEKDPDTEVKKKAVFALSQLPKDEGVPLADQGRAHQHQPGGPQAGDVLARAVEGPDAALEFFAENPGLIPK